MRQFDDRYGQLADSMIADDSTPPDTGEPASEGRCACGAVHRTTIDTVVIDDRAIERLGLYLKERGWSRPLVVMDANTAEVAGERVRAELKRAKLRALGHCFPERSGLLADESGVSRLQDALGESDADSLVAVGSGVITDITRYVAHRAGREFVSVPTAASMDGYASSVAAMEFSGMKVSFSAVAPVAIFADPEIVAAAPLDMTRAGIGDLLGKTTARVDWLIAHLLYGESHCATVEQRVAQPVLQAAERVDEILAGSVEAVKALLVGLIESGKAMAMVDSSRPASGCEHHASHFWDMLAARGVRPHSPHGLQVGYATHFAMRLQRFALGGAVATLVGPNTPAELSTEGRSWFSGHLGEVEAVMGEKRRFADDHAHAWPRGALAWQAVQERAASAMEVFPLVETALRAARIPDEPGYLEIDAAILGATFRFANRMRSRYTVLDFLEGQGRLDEAVDAVLLGTD